MAKKKIEKIEDLAQDPRNVRLHGDQNEQVIRESLSTYGAGRSIVVDRDGVAIGGNAVLKAAQEQGMPIRVVETEGNELVVVQRKDLSANDPRRRGLAIADNRAGDLSEFDGAKLVSELREIGDGQDLMAAGFRQDEIETLFDAYPPPSQEIPDMQGGGAGDQTPEPSGGGGSAGGGAGEGGEKGPKNRRDPREPRVVTCPHCHEPFELPE